MGKGEPRARVEGVRPFWRWLWWVVWGMASRLSGRRGLLGLGELLLSFALHAGDGVAGALFGNLTLFECGFVGGEHFDGFAEAAAHDAGAGGVFLVPFFFELVDAFHAHAAGEEGEGEGGAEDAGGMPEGIGTRLVAMVWMHGEAELCRGGVGWFRDE